MQPYKVAVKDLAKFTAQRGSLDLRFRPSPSAEQGQNAHQAHAINQGPDYQAEYAVQGQYLNLSVAGRADGVNAQARQVQEIKTHRVAIERVPENHRELARAQLWLYGAMVCMQEDWPSVELELVYVHVATQRKTIYTDRPSRDTLIQHFNQAAEAYLVWAEQEDEHRQARDAHLEQLQFPYETFREGQRYLSEQVYLCLRDRQHLLAQATTGIGKTLGTLFPQLKGMPRVGLDRVFFLSAKTPGRALALEALRQLKLDDAPLRVLEMVSLEKSCEHPDKACHGDSCPLANGFYDRLPAARLDAVKNGWLNQSQLRQIALRHSVCPYWLSSELAKYADVVIGDYNYYFDSSALLYALASEYDWSVAVLVDEAHNLMGRAREMYSVELSQEALDQAMQSAPAKIKRALRPVAELWPNLFGTQEADYAVYQAIPERLINTLAPAISAISDAIADQLQQGDGEHMRFFFDALSFVRLAEYFDDDSLFDVTLDQSNPLNVTSTLGIRNMIPAKFLADRFGDARSCALFSATLAPPEYHRSMLGLPQSTLAIDVPAPFKPEQLDVRIMQHLSTAYADRADNLPAIVEVVHDRVRAHPGNYLVFFSSYEFQSQFIEGMRNRAPEIQLHNQTRNMSEIDRTRWVDDFTEHSQLLGTAVLGGAFGEGIDLPGKRLIGCFITTLGLPFNSLFNQQLQATLDARGLNGWDYTYRYVGLQKVVQAAGRVIRDVQDQGCVYLMDRRYAQSENLALLPRWWDVKVGLDNPLSDGFLD